MSTNNNDKLEQSFHAAWLRECPPAVVAWGRAMLLGMQRLCRHARPRQEPPGQHARHILERGPESARGRGQGSRADGSPGRALSGGGYSTWREDASCLHVAEWRWGGPSLYPRPCAAPEGDEVFVGLEWCGFPVSCGGSLICEAKERAGQNITSSFGAHRASKSVWKGIRRIELSSAPAFGQAHVECQAA